MILEKDHARAEAHVDDVAAFPAPFDCAQGRLLKSCPDTDPSLIAFESGFPEPVKLTIDLIGFVPGMNPRPTARTRLSAACEAPCSLRPSFKTREET
jgi:hypothetical protein